MVSGELKSDSERYMEVAVTPQECQRRVKRLVPNADGITWTHMDHGCYAKFGSSETTIDAHGCSFCESCSFGKSIFLMVIAKTTFNLICLLAEIFHFPYF